MMHFDRRFLLVVAVSLAWALLVSGVFYRLAGGAGRHARAASQKQVVVATRPLTAGSTLDRDSVKLRSVPDDLFPAGGFSRVEDVLERPVISAIQADEPVVEARVAVKGSGMGLGPMIPPGMRAISVRVNDVVGVAGFVLPGMRVDVLVTGKPPNRPDTETRTVLQNITVLSAGQTIQTDGKSQPIMAPVVTLLVSPADAEALTLSNVEGHIQLVLRNSTDRGATATRGRRLRELYGAAEAVEPSDEALPRPTRKPATAAAVDAKPAGPPQAASPALVLVPGPEPEKMIVIRGAVKTLEVFSREQVAK
jgi:pilus assembly protein CpaB